MTRRTLYAFIISFVLLTTVVGLNRVTFQKMQEYNYLVNHTRDVITTFESISNDFKSAQIYTTTYKEDSLKNFYGLYKKEADEINPHLVYLKKLVKDNPVQSRRVDSLAFNINKHLPLLMEKNIAEIIGMGEGWKLNQLFAIHQMINDGIKDEKEFLNHSASVLSNFTKLNNWLSVAFGVLAVSIFLFTFLNNLFISKRRLWLEGFLESILNTSQNGIIHCKAIRKHGRIIDYRIEFLNKATAPLFGSNSNAIIGKKLSEVSSLPFSSELVNKFNDVVETSVPPQFETLYQKQNTKQWLLISIAKLNDGITASFHDISQLKNFEEELKNKITDLERSNAELEQYAYVASHDLQEPLRKIRSFGSYLEDTQANKLDERGQDLLRKIMSSADRMSLLIKDILSYSSLKKQADYAPVNLNEIVKTVEQDLDLLITQKHGVIKCEPLPVIEAIPLQMTQLFYNLINNSLKFTKEGESPTIKISCRKISPEEHKSSFVKDVGYYEITLNDNGIGFNKEHAEQIFGLFKRLNNKQLYAGSGIGLALCRKVVENHNGEIYATGKEGEGASFHIYLPEKQV
jgi:signal transduction histidine kinase